MTVFSRDHMGNKARPAASFPPEYINRYQGELILTRTPSGMCFFSPRLLRLAPYWENIYERRYVLFLFCVFNVCAKIIKTYMRGNLLAEKSPETTSAKS